MSGPATYTCSMPCNSCTAACGIKQRVLRSTSRVAAHAGELPGTQDISRVRESCRDADGTGLLIQLPVHKHHVSFLRKHLSIRERQGERQDCWICLTDQPVRHRHGRRVSARYSVSLIEKNALIGFELRHRQLARIAGSPGCPPASLLAPPHRRLSERTCVKPRFSFALETAACAAADLRLCLPHTGLGLQSAVACRYPAGSAQWHAVAPGACHGSR